MTVLVPLLLATSLAGCTVGPDFVPPAAPSVGGYTAGVLPATSSAKISGRAAQRFVSGMDVPGDWWRLFHSRQIDAFVAEAIANHPDLQSAKAALRQALREGEPGHG
ncbi:hypothetical protein FJ970_02925 [Mesorhizobium sp. B2-1-8]|uniref:hypothetical protein n=1 Tax=Mesorhizobium sp. B2-1-8 TaxID=2589967 RepID=UPI00112738DC|nr:hypothetical protein [Mesorhizobium sp. B2-1-8]UCI19940.1 hypothetical protein FJ970_02925 [Mesorhizobium sp. B2-1-8]